MKLQFIKMEIEGFKSIQKALTLHFSKHAYGLHYVKGINEVEPRLSSNGAGKSSLWDALTWIIFGKTVDNLRNNDVIPWFGSKKPKGILILKIDGKKRIIFRSASPNKLKLDEEDIGQEQLIKVLGLSFEVFTNTVLIGQGQPLFLERQPREKLDLFEEILNLERWDNRSFWSAAEASRYDTQKVEAETKLASLKNERKKISALIKECSSNFKVWRREQSNKKQNIEKELFDCKERYNKLKAEFDNENASYDMAETELKHFRSSKISAEKDFSTLNIKLSEAKAQLNHLKERLVELKSNLDKVGDRCALCGQPIKDTSLNKHKSKIKESIKELKSKIVEGIDTKLLKGVEKAANKLSNITKEQEKLQKKSDMHKWNMDHLQPNISELKAKIELLNKTTKEKEEEENPYRSQLKTLRKQKAKILEEIEECETILSTVNRKIQRAKFWVKGFKDIRLYVVDEVLQELQLTTDAMLEEVGLIGWSIRYDIEKETKSGNIQRGLNVEIHSPRYKSPVKWSNFSGGERQRLKLVGTLALSEVLLNHAGITTDLEILDEPTRGMSLEGRRDLCEFLAKRAESLHKHCYYADHNVTESAKFASTMTMIKTSKGSRLTIN